MQRVWKADPRKIRELLAALEGALSGLGYVRKRAVLTRVREPGVVHLFEVIRLQGEFVVNAGVIFEEVLQVARDAGDDWYLFSGDDPRREDLSFGMCQLIGNLGRLAEPRRDLTWKIAEAASPNTIETIVGLATQGASDSMEWMGTRAAFLERWRQHTLPADVRFAIQDAMRAQTSIPAWAAEAEQRIARQARDTGLMFWSPPVVPAAIIARHVGLLELAREILASEAAAVRPHRPLHADFLVKVMNLLGVAPEQT